jgi:hypothetical protein
MKKKKKKITFSKKYSYNSCMLVLPSTETRPITLLTIVNIVYFYMHVYSFLGRAWGID